jgi:hypothetical protein
MMPSAADYRHAAEGEHRILLLYNDLMLGLLGKASEEL